jgi:deoxyribodipyrimidine photo-lyase
MKSAFGIHWFRRDLRVAGNPALQVNWKKHEGRVVGLFCFDPIFLARPDFSPDRFRFFLETLRALKLELQELGSDLLVLDEGPDKTFQRLFKDHFRTGEPKPSLVTFNRDYEPFAIQRDTRVTRLLESELGCEVLSEADHVLVEPSEIVRPDKPYQVYSPYKRKWLEIFQTETIQARVRRQKAGLEYLEKRAAGEKLSLFKLTWRDLKTPSDDCLEKYLSSVVSRVPVPAAGSLAAFAAMKAFAPKVSAYGETRDLPAAAGTSRLSIYFKNGSFTVAQAIAYLGFSSVGAKDTSSKAKFLSELIWREFYYYILYHHPNVEREAFQERFRTLKWENREDYFEAWKEGRTGFPLVDAGMRELATTGWMHNRVRMVVASFLTKDLLIDWKWGERHFMERLLDGDLAPNNGGWQWAASTGCDPQPYFRIFNPTLQSEKFDPGGEYIRKFVPELRKVPAKEIHSPRNIPGYPAPIVEHSIQRAKALALFKGEPF